MKYLFAICICALITSCELNPRPPECILSKDFKNLQSGSEIYNSTVISLLENSIPDDYRYFFKTFIELDKHTIMLVNFRNEATCFDVSILVDKWNKLAGMRKVNGASYPKELVKLKWSIELIDGNKTVVYKDMNTIID